MQMAFVVLIVAINSRFVADTHTHAQHLSSLPKSFAA